MRPPEETRLNSCLPSCIEAVAELPAGTVAMPQYLPEMVAGPSRSLEKYHDWWQQFNHDLEAVGLRLLSCSPFYKGYWIAAIPMGEGRNWWHAIVCRGRRVVYDPNGGKKEGQRAPLLTPFAWRVGVAMRTARVRRETHG